MAQIERYEKKDVGSLAIDPRVEPSNKRSLQYSAIDNIVRGAGQAYNATSQKNKGAALNVALEGYKAHLKKSDKKKLLQVDGIAANIDQFAEKSAETLGHDFDKSVLNDPVFRARQNLMASQVNRTTFTNEASKTKGVTVGQARAMRNALNKPREDGLKEVIAIQRRELGEAGVLFESVEDMSGGLLSPQDAAKTFYQGAAGSLLHHYSISGQYSEAKAFIGEQIAHGNMTPEEGQAFRKKIVSDINSRTAVDAAVDNERDAAYRSSYDRKMREIHRAKEGPPSQLTREKRNALAKIPEAASASRAAGISRAVEDASKTANTMRMGELLSAYVQGEIKEVEWLGQIDVDERRGTITPAQAVKLRQVGSVSAQEMQRLVEGIGGLHGPSGEGFNNLALNPALQNAVAGAFLVSRGKFRDQAMAQFKDKSIAEATINSPPTAAALGMLMLIQPSLGWDEARMYRVVMEGMKDDDLTQFKEAMAKVRAAKNSAASLGNSTKEGELQRDMDIYLDIYNKYKHSEVLTDKLNRIETQTKKPISWWDFISGQRQHGDE